MLNKVYLYDLDYFLLSLLTAFADKEWDLKLSGNGLQDELHRPVTMEPFEFTFHLIFTKVMGKWLSDLSSAS